MSTLTADAASCPKNVMEKFTTSVSQEITALKEDRAREFRKKLEGQIMAHFMQPFILGAKKGIIGTAPRQERGSKNVIYIYFFFAAAIRPHAVKFRSMQPFQSASGLPEYKHDNCNFATELSVIFP
jgi:hypothetical protein